MKAYLNEKKLEDYLGRKLVCREERQFALFLYLAFLEKKKEFRPMDYKAGEILSGGRTRSDH